MSWKAQHKFWAFVMVVAMIMEIRTGRQMSKKRKKNSAETEKED